MNKQMSKQDRQGVRTASDLERKYNLGDISKNRGNDSKQDRLLQQINQDLAVFKKQTNAKIEELEENDKMWFYSGAPTLENHPAVDWNTNELKAKHIGDMYYDVDNGNMYIFKYIDGTYLWESCFGGGVDYDTAYNEGHEVGYAEGENAEWSDFWDDFQYNGTRRNYQYAFGIYSWSDKTFKPKYDLIVVNGAQMFNQNMRITNLKNLLANAGVILDFSNCTNALQCFQLSKITHIPTLDCSKLTNTRYAFASSNIVEIEKLIFTETTTYDATTFQNATAIETLIIEGVIAKNGFDVHWSTKLSKASLLSILKALNITVSSVTVTLPAYCIDGTTDTLTTIQNDTELNFAYTTAIANGYAIVFV